jgi:hypothetical protein
MTSLIPWTLSRISVAVTYLFTFRLPSWRLPTWRVALLSLVLYAMVSSVLAWWGILPLAFASPGHHGIKSLSTSKSSLTLLYQNNLNDTDASNHAGAILLDSLPYSQAASACSGLGESLLSKKTIDAHKSDFEKSLAYVEYATHGPCQFWIKDGVVNAENGQLWISSLHSAYYHQLRPLCSQSATESMPSNASSTTKNNIRVAAAGNTYVGFRNKKSFRFQGLRYAYPPKRWVYPTLYKETGKTIEAYKYGAACLQSGNPSSSEDCLTLNINTPYLPKEGSKKGLKPVFFWIHGGGFVGGRGADPQTDGGNLASREDVVVVTIQYRLATLGFLAVPGTNIRGNYGIADQVTALDVSLLYFWAGPRADSIQSGYTTTLPASVATPARSPSAEILPALAQCASYLARFPPFQS